MRRLILLAVTAGLLLLPCAGFAADYGAKSKDKPPVSQPLVREGDYAVKLVNTLHIGKVTDETKAEDVLAAAGIAPKSGWISDFPVTPEIVAQVQTSVGTASDGGKIPLGRTEADKEVIALNTELGLGIAPANGKGSESAEAAPQYSEPAVINNYYYDEGPPVVTYYAPPPDYWYLYAWDPWPFWWGGIFFPGFFVLADFDRPCFIRNGVVVFSNNVVINARTAIVSNHVIDPVTRASVRIDPVSVRPTARTSFRPIGARSWTPVASRGGLAGRTATSLGGGFNRTSASHILSHSASFSRPAGTRTGGSWTRSGSIANRGVSSSRGRSFSNSGGRSYGGGRSYNSAPSGGRSFGGGGRSFNSAPSGGRSFGGGGRSYNSAPSGGRSFGGGGRSFNSAPSGGRSFGGGGGGRSFGGGGGGCRGRC